MPLGCPEAIQKDSGRYLNSFRIYANNWISDFLNPISTTPFRGGYSRIRLEYPGLKFRARKLDFTPGYTKTPVKKSADSCTYGYHESKVENGLTVFDVFLTCRCCCLGFVHSTYMIWNIFIRRRDESIIIESTINRSGSFAFSKDLVGLDDYVVKVNHFLEKLIQFTFH